METRLFAFIFHITPAFFAHGENNFAQKVFQILLSARRCHGIAYEFCVTDIESSAEQMRRSGRGIYVAPAQTFTSLGERSTLVTFTR